jgi:hypothetical protein
VTVNNKNFNDDLLAKTIHKYYTDINTSNHQVGMEYETQYQDSQGNILSKTNTSYTTVTSGTTGHQWYYVYANEVDEYLLGGTNLKNKTVYTYDTSTGNLLTEVQYDGSSPQNPYRETDYEYLNNITPPNWILGKVSKKTLKDASGQIISQVRYGYDTNLVLGELRMMRVIEAPSLVHSIDTGYAYDAYGNLTSTVAKWGRHLPVRFIQSM